MPDPVPFEIVDAGNGHRVASNGTATLSLLEADGQLFKRRAIKGINVKPAGEMALPLVNEFAGELLAKPEMAAHLVRERLHAIASLVVPKEPQRIEWAVADVAGVRVYFDGNAVIVTRQDLTP